MGDHVIVTGGSYDSHVRAEVSVYNAQGWLEDYAGLNTGRKEHGCGHYINGDNNVVRVIFNAMFLILLQSYNFYRSITRYIW